MSDRTDLKSSGFCAQNEEPPPVSIRVGEPKPPIKVESCRPDGRCPECGCKVHSSLPWVLPCGCRSTRLACAAAHLRALLTEALRQRDRAIAGDNGTQQVLRDVREERDAAIREAAKANIAVEAIRAALYEQRDRADAAIRERDEALDHSKCWPAIREQADRAMFASHAAIERAEKAEALLRKCHSRLLDNLEAPALRMEIEALLG